MRDLALTSVTALITGLGFVLTLWIVARYSTPGEYGTFNVARTLVFTLLPLTSAAMNVTLARQLASVPTDEHGAYFKAASRIASVVVIPVCALLLAFPAQIAQLAGDHRITGAVRASVATVVGLSFLEVLVGYFRGRGEILKANGWRLFALGAAPIAVAISMEVSAAPEDWVLAAGLPSLASVPAIVWLYLRLPGSAAGARSLFEYARGRIPAGFLLTLLFGVGTVLAARFGSVEEAGYVATAIAALAVGESLLYPVSFVALPRFASLLARGERSALEARLWDAVCLAIHVGLFLSLHVAILAPTIVAAWLGPQFAAADVYVRFVAAGFPPFLVYVLLRSAVDAVEMKALNTRNLAWASGVAMSSSWIFGRIVGPLGVLAGVMAGLYVLGALTIWRLHKMGLLRQGLFGLPAVAAGLAVTGLAAVGATALVLRSGTPISMTAGAIVFMVEAAMGLLYLVVLRRGGVGWVRELEVRLIRGHPPT